MTRVRWAWPAAIAAMCTAVALLSLTGPSTIRTLVMGAFLLLCPGMAFVRLIGLEDTWAELAVGTAASLALGILVTAGQLYAHAWSPTASAVILIDLSLVGAALQLRPGHRLRLLIVATQLVGATILADRVVAPALVHTRAPGLLNGAEIVLLLALVLVLGGHQLAPPTVHTTRAVLLRGAAASLGTGFLIITAVLLVRLAT